MSGEEIDWKAAELAVSYRELIEKDLSDAKTVLAFAVEKFKRDVDAYLERGAAQFNAIVDVARRSVKGETAKVAVTTRMLYCNMRIEFELVLARCLSPDSVPLRDALLLKLSAMRDQTLDALEEFKVCQLIEIKKYREAERTEVSNVFGKHRYEAWAFFSRAPPVDRSQSSAGAIEREIALADKREGTEQDYEKVAEESAACFDRTVQRLMNLMLELTRTLADFSKESIDDNLKNGIAVFDTFIAIPFLATQKILSEILKSIEDAGERLLARVKRTRENCKAGELTDEFLYRDAIEYSEAEWYRETSRMTTQMENGLKAYRKEERDEATKACDSFKRSVHAETLGSRFGEYVDLSLHVLEPVGEGAQAVVYSTEMEIDGAPMKVALKKVTPGSEPEIRVSSIKHPNVLKYLKLGKKGEELYLISEFCPRLLSDELKKGLDKSTFIKGIIGIAEAMLRLIVNELYHGDLKPLNILMTEDGTFKLADFGLSKTFDQVKLYRRDRDWGGTTPYMAPELIRAKSPFKGDLERCEVWSFGVVVWETMTGRPPFHGMQPEQLTALIGELAAHPPLPREPGLESLLNLLRRCWAKEIGDRPTFTTITELLKGVHQEIEEMDEEEWRAECGRWREEAAAGS